MYFVENDETGFFTVNCIVLCLKNINCQTIYDKRLPLEADQKLPGAIFHPAGRSQVTVCRHAGEFLTDLDCKLRIQETSSHLTDLIIDFRCDLFFAYPYIKSIIRKRQAEGSNVFLLGFFALNDSTEF